MCIFLFPRRERKIKSLVEERVVGTCKNWLPKFCNAERGHGKVIKGYSLQTLWYRGEIGTIHTLQV